MAKNVLLKTGLCLVASLMIQGNAKAMTIDSEQGLAGLSYKVDQYFKVYDEEISDKFELGIQSTNDVAVASEVSDVAVARTVEEKSKFDKIGISIAESYVRVRKSASTDSEVVGKLYKGCVADIVKYEGDWAKIKSGNVSGYILADYLAVGKDAEAIVDDYVSKTATVNTETLKVREKKSVESACLTLIPQDETYDVIKETDKWVKILIDDGDIKGYVSKDYVKVEYKFEYAISIEEEKAKIAAEEAAKRAEEERLAALAAQQQAAQNQQQSNNSSSNSNSNSSSNNSSSNKKQPSTNNNNSSSSNSNSSSSNSSSSSSGSAIANYALKFVGNPYVYGGTSLTKGADCSGFIQSVYRNFGYSLPRTSGAQSSAGRAVSLSNLQPGDVIYYTSGGSVSHVSMYIGNGKVVHASNRRDGIKISSYNYRTPAGARRIVG